MMMASNVSCSEADGTSEPKKRENGLPSSLDSIIVLYSSSLPTKRSLKLSFSAGAVANHLAFKFLKHEVCTSSGGFQLGKFLVQRGGL